MIKRELIRKVKKTYLTISSTNRIRIIRKDNLILSAKKTSCISVKKSLQLVTVRKYLFSEPLANKRFFCGQNIELVTVLLRSTGIQGQLYPVPLGSRNYVVLSRKRQYRGRSPFQGVVPDD